MTWTWPFEFDLFTYLQTESAGGDSKDAADDVRLHRRAWGR
jgi:hypothetical protein